jgi:hypothetical protein
MSAGTINNDRAQQLSNAVIVLRILDDSYFKDALAAINAHSKKDFQTVCTKAKIPDDLAERLWAYATVAVPKHKYQW